MTFLLRCAPLALALSVAHPAVLEAQVVPHLTMEEQQTLDDARGLRDAGAGLTLAGIATTGLGVGLMFGIRGFENWGGVIGGGVLEGLGGLMALIGMPMWVVGGVRSDVLSRPVEERASVADAYQIAGMIVTLTGIAACLLGGALIGAAMAMNDARSQGIAGAGAYGLMPAGAFLASFIGAPLWAEGARF